MICKFTASQSVDIPVVEQKVPIQHYLRQPKRLVNALVDPTRLEQLDQAFSASLFEALINEVIV